MRLLPSSLLLLSLLPGCPGDEPDPVELQIRGDRASLLAARQGTDPWQPLTADASGRTTFTVDRTFELVGVCEDFGGEVYAYAGGPEDGIEADPYKFDIGCGDPAFNADITVTTTSLAQLKVFIGYSTLDVSAGFDDRAVIVPGRHDIVILDENEHLIAIRRGVELAAGTRIEVDLTGAVALVERPVTATAASRVNSRLITASGTRASLGRLLDRGWTIPAAIAVADDIHYVNVVEYDEAMPRSRYRTVRIEPGATTPLAVTLPPHLAGATLSWDQAPAATFTAGEWDEILMFGYQTDADLAPLWLVVSYAHAARTPGALTAPAGVTGIAGWDAAWNADDTGSYYLGLSMSRETADGGEGVNWDLDVLLEKGQARAVRARDRLASRPQPTAKAQRLADMRP